MPHTLTFRGVPIQHRQQLSGDSLDAPPDFPPPPGEDRHPINELHIASVWVLDLLRQVMSQAGSRDLPAGGERLEALVEQFRYARARLERAIERLGGTTRAGTLRCRVTAPGVPPLRFECRPGEERSAALAAVMDQYITPQFFAGFFPVTIEVLKGEDEWTPLPAA